MMLFAFNLVYQHNASEGLNSNTYSYYVIFSSQTPNNVKKIIYSDYLYQIGVLTCVHQIVSFYKKHKRS